MESFFNHELSCPADHILVLASRGLLGGGRFNCMCSLIKKLIRKSILSVMLTGVDYIKRKYLRLINNFGLFFLSFPLKFIKRVHQKSSDT